MSTSNNSNVAASSTSLDTEQGVDVFTKFIEADIQEHFFPVLKPVAPLQQLLDLIPVQTRASPCPYGPSVVPLVSPGADDSVVIEDVFSSDNEKILDSPLGNEFSETDQIDQNLNNIFT